MDLKIVYSTVASATDTGPKRVVTTWRKLVKRLAKVEVRGNVKLKKYLTLPRREKAKLKNGPGWIPGSFVKGGRRLDVDTKRLYAFVGDCDNTKGAAITLESLRAALNGTEAVIHTTYSHSKAKPKFRFVVPYTKPIRPGDHIDIFNHFNARVGGGLDPKGKTPSQLYYWPSTPPDAIDAFHFEHLRGRFFNPAKHIGVASPAPRDRPIRDVTLPDELPEVDIEKLEISERIKTLIREGVDPHNRYASRSEAIFAVVLALMSRGCTDEQIAGICLDPRYKISEKTLEQKKPRAYLVRTLRKARNVKFVGDGRTVDEVVSELNAKHAVVTVGGRVVILNEGHDPILDRHEVTLSQEKDLRLLYANRKLMLNEKPVNIADLWLSHESRRQYDRIIFSPERDVPGCYNLWRGFAVIPRPGNCDLYLRHIRENIAQGDDQVYRYVIGFMADAVQNPRHLPGVTFVMRGDEGLGKGVFATEFGRLFGQHFIPVSNSRHLVGNFNAHLKDALLVFADEAFWAGDKGAQGVLNAMITEEQRVIEHKGKDPITVMNYIRLIIASNHDWVVPAGPTARRFFVVDVGDKHREDYRYFTAIRKQMNKGGREALLHFLLNYDLSGFDLRNFPRTEALLDQKVRSMTAEEKFWMDRLRRGEVLNHAGKWNTVVKCGALYEQYIHFAQKTGFGRRAYETELGMFLNKTIPGLRRKRRPDPDNPGKKVSFYVLPSLDACRDAFEKRLKMKIDWDK